jgi:RNA polymerase sigma-70 factor (ECF subfamily)
VELPDDLPDPGPGPLVRVEQASELGAVLAGLRRLPESDRSALLMRALHGMPYQEIARSLGLTLAAVKVKIHRARKALLAERDEQLQRAGGGGKQVGGRSNP